MKRNEFQLGMRVRRCASSRSFVQDRNRDFQPRRVGIVVGLPEVITPSHYAATIQWEGSSLRDSVQIHRLEALPLEEQPIALGGKWVPTPTTFVGRCVG